MNPKLHFTIGAARSGKSTFAREWVRESGPNPRVVWNSDSCRLALHGERYASEAEPMVFAVKNYAIRTLLLSGHDVLVDGTHTTRESIKRLLEIDEEPVAYLFDTPAHVCIQRAHDTGQSDLVPVIERHSRQIQEILTFGYENLRAEILAEIKGRRAA